MELELDLREGWVEPELADEFPELGLTHAPIEARAGRSPREVKNRLARHGRPLHGRKGDPHAPGPGSVGVPGVLTPGRDRPGQRAHAGRGDRPRAAEARRTSEREPARRRAHDRHRRDRRAADRAGRRPRATGNSDCASPRSGESLGPARPLSAARSWWRTRAAPVAVGARRRGRGRRRHPPHRADGAVRALASRACRASAWRRRSGSRPRCSFTLETGARPS